MAAVDDQSVMGLDEDQSLGGIGDLLMHGMADRRDFAAVNRVVRLESEEMGIASLVQFPGREPGHFVDVLLAGLAVQGPGQIVQERPGPGVAGLRVGRDPDYPRVRHGNDVLSLIHISEPTRLGMISYA